MAMVGRETCNHEWMENWQRNGAALSMEDSTEENDLEIERKRREVRPTLQGF